MIEKSKLAEANLNHTELAKTRLNTDPELILNSQKDANDSVVDAVAASSPPCEPVDVVEKADVTITELKSDSTVTLPCYEINECENHSSENLNFEAYTMNDFDIPVASTSVIIENNSEQSDQEDLRSAATPKKSRPKPPFILEESPAKNTRSKTKLSAAELKGKTPRVVIRKSKKNKTGSEKRKSKSKKETKTLESKSTQSKSKQQTPKKISRTESVEPETSKNISVIADDFGDAPNSPSDSPTNILAAVSLQNTPRKLTLRYGLRSTISGTCDSPEHQPTFAQRSSSLSNPPVPLAASQTPTSSNVSLDKVKNDLLDSILADPRTSVIKGDDKVDFASENIADLNTVSGTVQLDHDPSTSMATEPDHTKPSVLPSTSGAGFPTGQETVQTNSSPTMLRFPAPTVTVPLDQSMHLESIVENLVLQVKQSKSRLAKNVDPTKTMSMETALVSTSHQSRTIQTLLHTTAPQLQPLAPFHSTSNPAVPSVLVAMSSASHGTVAHLSEPAMASVKNLKEQDIESLCKNHVTGESLTVLLNETSLTQMIEAVAENEGDQHDPEVTSEPNTDHFRTISPSAGVFSVLDHKKTDKNFPPSLPCAPANDSSTSVTCTMSVAGQVPPPVLTTESQETAMATQHLRAWLNSHPSPTEIPSKPVRKVETVIRSLNFGTTEPPNRTTKTKTTKMYGY